MKPHVSILIRSLDKVLARYLLQFFLGITLPLGVTIIVALALLESDAFLNERANAGQKVSAFLSTSGMSIGCVIALAGNARLRGLRSAGVRVGIGLSTFLAVVLLIETGRYLAEQLEPHYGYYYFEQALFVSVPLLIVSVALFSCALRRIEARIVQLLVFVGFLAATVFVQFYLLLGSFDAPEMMIWNLNSLLVGLICAIWLCAWGAKEFRNC